MTYESKVDVYLLAAIALALFLFFLGDHWIAGPVLLVLLLCAYPQKYEITPRALVVRAALARQTIPYEAISYIGPCPEQTGRLLLSSERVRIQYGLASEVFLAPANPREFLSAIAPRTPHLIRRGPRLVAAFA
jgi:hypothetical protein